MTTWRLRDVADAVGMSARALRQAFDLGALRLSGDDKRATGSGSRVGLSINRAYDAAIMKQLNNLGLSLPVAAKAAEEFTNVGNSNRKPGQLFEHGTTSLLITQHGTTVKNTFSDADVLAFPCAIFVNVNAIVDHIDSALIPKKAS